MDYYSVKKIINKIKNEVGFSRVFEDEWSIKKVKGNYTCPFCQKEGVFRIYDDQNGFCFNDVCQWKGDLVEFYKDLHKVSLKKSVNDIREIYNVDISKIEEGEKLKNLYLKEENKKQKFYQDCKFIDTLKVMMIFLELDTTWLSKKLNISRQQLSYVLNKQWNNNKQIGFNKWSEIVLKLNDFYQDNKDEFLYNLSLSVIDKEVIEGIKGINKYYSMLYEK